MPYNPKNNWIVDSGYYGNLNASFPKRSFRFTAQNSKEVSSIFISTYNLKGTSPTYEVGIWDDSGGEPNTLLASSTTQLPDDDWLEVSIPNIGITKGDVYHVVIAYFSGTIDDNNYATLRYVGPGHTTIPYDCDSSDTQQKVLYYSDGTSSWNEYSNASPCFVLKFSDGSSEGFPYDRTSSIGINGSYWKGQFHTTETGFGTEISTFGAYIKKSTASNPADDLYYEIRDDEENILRNGTLVTATTVTENYAWYDATLSSNLILKANTTYRFVVNSPNSDSTDYYIIRRNYTPGGDSAEAQTYFNINSRYCYSNDSGSTWYADGSRDLSFRCTLESTSSSSSSFSSSSFSSSSASCNEYPNSNLFRVDADYYTSLKYTDQKWAFRFTAQNSGQVSKAYVYIEKVEGDFHPTYRLGIQADDGAGNPDGTWLASDLIQFTEIGWWWVPLDAQLTAGNIYYIVIEYHDGAVSETDYAAWLTIKPNNLMIPKGNTADSQQCYKHYKEGSWNWYFPDHQGIYAIEYSDGTYEGQPYGDNWAYISQNWTHSQIFQTESFYRVINSIAVRVSTNYESSAPPEDHLYYEIRDHNENVLRSGILCDKSDAPQLAKYNYSWKYVSFSELQLNKNDTYRIVFKSPNTTHTNRWHIQANNSRDSSLPPLTETTYQGILGYRAYSSDGGITWSPEYSSDFTWTACYIPGASVSTSSSSISSSFSSSSSSSSISSFSSSSSQSVSSSSSSFSSSSLSFSSSCSSSFSYSASSKSFSSSSESVSSSSSSSSLSSLSSSCSSKSSSSSISFSSSSFSFSSSSSSSCSSSWSSSSFSFSSSSFSSCSSSLSSSSFSFSLSSSSSSSLSSISISSSSLSKSSSSFSSHSISSSSSSKSTTPTKKIITKLYDRNNKYQRVLTEATDEISIEKTLYRGSGAVNLILTNKIDDLAEDITLNSKIRIYFRNKWSKNPVLVYHGYITSIDPSIEAGEERTSITCLGAISKLQNDFLQQTGEYLAFEVENVPIHTHIKKILDNYRSSINDTYGDYDPCMIEPTTYFPDETGAGGDSNYVEDTSSAGNIPYRYFTMKHLEAIKEIGKFLPKNQAAANYWYYYLGDDGKFYLKKLSASADHTLQINKHIDNLSLRKNTEGLINTVYFWNEQGRTGEKVLTTAKDTDSQKLYDRIADRITDSKVSTYTQADLLAKARLNEAKDVKSELTITVSDANYDILSFKLGQTVNIRDTKKGTDLYPDDILVIQKIILTPNEAVLELSKPRPDLSTQVETDREYIDRQLIWFGDIMTRIDASRLEPGALHWITEDIKFTAPSNEEINWTGGTFQLPNGVDRVIESGSTGTMDSDTTYYLYLDEKNVWCGKDKDTPSSPEASGTGSVKAGENSLVDTGADWKKDQWKGYVLWVNPGSKPEKHIIAQNYEHEIIVEGHDPFNTTDESCSYEIYKLVLRKTTKLSKRGVQATAGSSTSLRDNALNETDDFWNGYELKILSGDNMGLTRTVTDFKANIRTLYFDALPYPITEGTWYELYLNPEGQILISTGAKNENTDGSAIQNPKQLAVVPDYQWEGSTRAWDALDSSNNLTTDLINDRLDTSARYIKGEFTFTESGALKIATDANNGLWISPTGILAKKEINGVPTNTFTVDNLGNATFSGDLTAATGTFGGTILGGATIVDTIASLIRDRANDAFQKSSDNSADIIQDPNNRFVTSNEKIGAKRAYYGLDVNYQITKGIVTNDLDSRNLPYSGVRIDQSGIFGRRSGSTSFFISSTGDAYFSGKLGASSVEAGNWLRFLDSSNRVSAHLYASNYDLLITGDQSVSDILINSGSSGAIGFSRGGDAKAVIGNEVEIDTIMDMHGNRIKNLGTPSYSTDAATKAYVDSQAGFSCSNLSSCQLNDLGTANGNYSMGGHSITNINYLYARTLCLSGYCRSTWPSAEKFSCSDLSSCTLANLKDCWKSNGGYHICDLGDIWPARDAYFELGYSWRKWYKVWRKYEGSCALPTNNSAIDVLKKITDPKKRKGEYGYRHYFEDNQFPDEMKMFATREGEKTGKGKKEIEHVQSLGVVIQAVRELIKKVEFLETKLKNT